MAQEGLIHGPLGRRCLHVCVDMQVLFLPGSPWANPWMERVLPMIVEMAGSHKEQTVFTRFIPASSAATAPGLWRRYYEKWQSMTLDQLDGGMIELVPALASMAPPAHIVDKRVYSPWTEGKLDRLLASSDIDTLVISGGETDVCVLATVIGAIDRGFRTVIAADAICGSADETHDAAMTLYASRFSQQVEIAETREIMAGWS